MMNARSAPVTSIRRGQDEREYLVAALAKCHTCRCVWAEPVVQLGLLTPTRRPR
jgi:hypothetical protein